MAYVPYSVLNSEELEEFYSLVSISAVRVMCTKNTQKKKQEKTVKIIKDTLILVAVCFYIFICLYTKTPDKLERLLL